MERGSKFSVCLKLVILRFEIILAPAPHEQSKNETPPDKLGFKRIEVTYKKNKDQWKLLQQQEFQEEKNKQDIK